MTPEEAGVLLAGIAQFDNRKAGDKEQAQQAMNMWAAALHDIRLVDAAAAVTQHFATSTDYLMPVHIRTLVKAMRSKRIAEAGPLTPPPGLTPIETNRWLGEARSRVGDGEDPATVNGDHGELKPRHLPDLRALMPAPDDGHPGAGE